jgi:two-component system nitrogen regulation sensor histidine kinase NtrY
VNAEAPINVEPRTRWQRKLSVVLRRSRIVPLVELATVITLIVVAAVSYFIINRHDESQALLTPPLVASLLVANLVPAMALMVLFARRIAMKRAAQSPIGGRGRLHVRLVALFSVIASVPTLLVVIFASLLFQIGTDFWFSARARGMLENATAIAKSSYNQELERVNGETVTMAADLSGYLAELSYDNPAFIEGFGRQVYLRNLSEAIILKPTKGGEIDTLALVNPYDRDLGKVVQPQVFAQLRGGKPSVTIQGADRLGSVTALPGTSDIYLYAARVFDPQMTTQLNRADAVLADYRALIARSKVLQFRFNAALLLISLLIVGLAIWIALTLADRLVRPVGELVDAARRVTAGDLSARVPASRVRDEVGTLGSAFNRMTRRLEEQTGALVSANRQLDSRRALMEAVLSGVTAGVLSVDNARQVRLINSSAEGLLKVSKENAVGRKLGDLAPELDQQLDAEQREDIIQFSSGGEPRTLAVNRVRVEGGHVLTFDDITDQLQDQRRAAWSDVARRIAHEIKNPLTPIQLAAERLQRRYAGEITSDPTTFERLTGTIVRQVGDLRRMVDEFSSFARMPKPVFRDEAIQQKRENGAVADGRDAVAITIREGETQLCIDIADTGVGLPQERGRLTEPYMTTRAKGTGLGLAIVKKIVEEHFGSIDFEDGPAGRTLVRLVFDTETLARLRESADIIPEEQSVNG